MSADSGMLLSPEETVLGGDTGCLAEAAVVGLRSWRADGFCLIDAD